MPDHEVALQLLARTGPMAVSSANLTGKDAATDADSAEEMLGDSVEVLLDGGPTPGSVPSTIVDATGESGRVLRLGAISLERLNEVVEPLGVTITGDPAERG
jgi:tRNA A37 threonylcarbamoyladenosine synthetase subunit TsaC/SUA5/YrdC